jgi:GTP-binding protein
MRFIDIAKIYIKSGAGGAGAVSFRREKFVPFGGPDGGNGGKGGDVVFVGTRELTTLLDFRFISRYIAKNGGNGSGSTSTGANGADLLVKVPVGTLVKNLETEEILADISEDGQRFIVLKGGRGGKGNDFFKSATNQAPEKAQPGEPSIDCEVQLELKLIADVGLLGMPNVGKSTFISRVSAAKPKIASYPFTTLVPNLGVVQGNIKKSFVIADIPGLIEGAHTGKGLGHKFLRHVERTNVLLHILDPVGKNAEMIIRDYKVINNELQKYETTLTKKPQIVAINKLDIPIDEGIEKELKDFFKSEGRELYFISAVSGKNLKPVLESLQRAL